MTSEENIINKLFWRHNNLTNKLFWSHNIIAYCILLTSQFYFKFISVPLLFWIILIIYFVIFRLLFKKPNVDFHRIVETCFLIND